MIKVRFSPLTSRSVNCRSSKSSLRSRSIVFPDSRSPLHFLHQILSRLRLRPNVFCSAPLTCTAGVPLYYQAEGETLYWRREYVMQILSLIVCGATMLRRRSYHADYVEFYIGGETSTWGRRDLHGGGDLVIAVTLRLPRRHLHGGDSIL